MLPVRRLVLILLLVLTLPWSVLSDNNAAAAAGDNSNKKLVVARSSSGQQQSQQKCQPQVITIPECRSVFYTHTGMPNLVQHENQEDAHRQLQSFTPLLSTQCSKKLRFFLCSVYTPMCDVREHYFVGPCRPLCEHVQRRCSPILQAFNLNWPENLQCHRFPHNNTADTMCMNGPVVPDEEKDLPLPSPSSSVQPFQENVDFAKFPCGHLKHKEKYIYLNDTHRCALLCQENAMFSLDDKRMAEIWMGVLSGLCFLSTLFTVLTFLLDPPRFSYPERPVIFLAFCYNIYSVAYFLRLAFGREQAACESWGKSKVLIEEGLDNVQCSVVFLLHFYFSTASSVWWLMLTLSWVLAACFKWADESIAQKSCYFHIVSWVTPAALTFLVLVMRTVDADELLGLCGVGQQKLSTLLTFIIIPQLIILSLGIIFLLTGFIAMVLIRRHMKHDVVHTERLEMFIVRIGLFSALYLVPAVCVLACNMYEYFHRTAWKLAQFPDRRPNAEVFMLKTFMSLVVGITSGVWIWSFKTLQYWRNFFRSLLFCYPKKTPVRKMLEDPANSSAGCGGDGVNEMAGLTSVVLHRPHLYSTGTPLTVSTPSGTQHQFPTVSYQPAHPVLSLPLQTSNMMQPFNATFPDPASATTARGTAATNPLYIQ